ncbi:MAG: hypothetical protein ACYSR8_12265 [Planctomycetota bacterium]
MGKRNLENVVIKSNRYTNEVFRKNYDKIRWKRKVRKYEIGKNEYSLEIPEKATDHFC